MSLQSLQECDTRSSVSNDEDYVVVESPSMFKNDRSDGTSPDASQEQREKIRGVLSSSSHRYNASEHRKNLKARTPGTCNWIQQTPEYLKWILSDHGDLLWISAPPGSGKSVLASSLIQEFQEDGEYSVCYFYFRQSQRSLQTAHTLPIDWISQIFETTKRPGIVEFLAEKIQSTNLRRGLEFDEWWGIFSEVAMRAGKIICAVDGIDELMVGDFENTGRTDTQDVSIVQRLVELAKGSAGNLKILVTSQPDNKTERSLSYSHVTHLNISKRQFEGDLGIYIDHRLEGRNDFILDQSARGDTSQSLALKADGSFLYARLALDDLLSSEYHGSLESFNSRFRSLPQGLYGLYSMFLEECRQCAGMSKGDLRLMLQWITHSIVPLHIQDLADVFNLSHGEPGKLEYLRPQAIKKIRLICGGLIEILEDEETLQIPEYSFTNFLSNTNHLEIQPDAFTSIKVPQHAHKAISLTCIEYLSLDCFKESWDHYNLDIGGLQGCCLMPNQRGSIYRERSEHYPLLRYASDNWARHVAAIGHDDTDVFCALDNFLDFNTPTFSTWNEYYWFMRRSQYPKRWSALHVASYFGLTRYTRHLLKNGASIDQVDGDGTSPLEQAAQRNHTGVAIQLIEAGAIPEGSVPEESGGKKSNRKMRPLHYAAKQGNAEIVRHLLLYGADPDPKYREPNMEWTQGEDRTPLHYACQGHHVEVVKDILGYLDLTDMPVLHWAAENGSHEIVQVLVEAGCSIDNENSDGMTPLGLACQSGSVATIKQLLKLGADPNKTGSKQKFTYHFVKGVSPLHIYCGRNQYGSGGKQSETDAEMAITALLDAGAQLEGRDINGETALFHAVREYARFDAVKYLVHGRGASVTARRTDNMQPIHVVGNRKALNLLIEAGADIEARDEAGQTPLMTTAGNLMWGDLYAELLLRGANVNAYDHEGTPLLILAARCQTYTTCERVKFLMEHGAEPNAADAKGRNLLHHFFSANDREGTQLSLADVLIENGCHVETPDYSGRTPLYTWASMGSVEMIRKLFNAGATVSIKDRQGMTPLHAAVGKDTTGSHGLMKKEKSEGVKTILEAGADVHAIDNLGNNALFTLIGSPDYNREIFETLITSGATPRSNFNGETLLHVACMKADVSALKDVLTLFPQLLINAVDHDGRGALQFASANSQFHVQVLLEAGCDPLQKDHQGRTALHSASSARKSDVVDVLAPVFSTHDCINLPDTRGRTALHDAARSGVFQSVNALLDHGADLQVKDRCNRNVLHAAAEFGDEQKIWDLLNPSEELSEERDITGVEVKDPIRRISITSCRGRSYSMCMNAPLEVSRGIQSARIYDVVDLLLERGVDYKADDKAGLNPLNLACLKSTPELTMAVFDREQRTDGTSDISTWIQGRIEKTADINIAMALYKTGVSVKALQDETMYASTPAVLNKALFYAVQHSHERLAFALLDRGASLIAPNIEDKTTSLHLAAAQGWCSIVLKASRGADFQVEILDEKGFTPLHMACLPNFDNSKMIRLLLELGADVNAKVLPKPHPNRLDYYSEQSYKEATPLCLLARSSYFWQPGALKTLAVLGADLNAACEVKHSALHHAIMGGFWKEQGVMSLLDLGANNSGTAIQLAVGDHTILKLLLNRGVDANSEEESPLFAAAGAFQKETVQVLLEAGFSPTGVNKEGMPILMHMLQSASFGTRKNASDIDYLIALLVSHGADPNQFSEVLENGEDMRTRSKKKEPPEPKRLLHLPEMIRRNAKQLIKCGMDINIFDSKGRSGLMLACVPLRYGNHYPGNNADRWKPSTDLLAIELIKAGADTFATDADGKSAMHYLFGSQDDRDKDGLMIILKALLDAGVSTTNPSTDGSIPLFQALSFHNLSAFELMISSGASITTKDTCGNTVAYHLLKCLLTRWHNWHGDDSILENIKTYVIEKFTSGAKPLNVNSKNATGNTPLSQLLLSAIVPKKAQALDFLKSLGVDLYCTNDKGQGLLHCLVQGEVDCEKPNEDFGFLIMAPMEMTQTFRTLMDEGLDENLVDADGKTALQLAEGDKFLFKSLKLTIEGKRNPQVENETW